MGLKITTVNFLTCAICGALLINATVCPGHEKTVGCEKSEAAHLEIPDGNQARGQMPNVLEGYIFTTVVTSTAPDFGQGWFIPSR